MDTSDASDRDPVRDFEIICGELAAFSESLADKPMIVVATKLDATTDRTRLDGCASIARSASSISTRSPRRAAKASRNWSRGMADALERLAPPEPVEAGEASSHGEADAHASELPGTKMSKASGAELLRATRKFEVQRTAGAARDG